MIQMELFYVTNTEKKNHIDNFDTEHYNNYNNVDSYGPPH